MKKNIFLFAFCMLPLFLFSQINVTGKYDNSKTEKKLLNLNFAFINYNPEYGFYLTGLKTTNSFDKGAILWLGASKESAEQSLKDLYGILLSEKKGYTFSIEMDGTRHVIRLQPSLGVPTFWIKSQGCAGEWWLTKQNILDALQWVQSNS